MSDSPGVIIFLVLLLLGIAIGAFFIVRHLRWKAKIKELGWRYDSNPSLAHVQTLGNPPFEVGLERKIDDVILGTTSAGLAFQSFEYKYTGGGPKFSDRVAMINLPLPLPELYCSSRSITPRRTGVRLPEVQVDPAFSAAFAVVAADPAYASAALSPAARQQIGEWSTTQPLDLSIDHQSLVALGAPKDPELLKEFLERLGGLAMAINPGSLQEHAIAPKQPRFGFYGQDWVLADRDDSLIPHFSGLWPFGIGHGHRTSQVVRGTSRGLPLTAFNYHWQTTRTVTTTDSKGRSHTRTVTDNHDQALIVLIMPVQIPGLSIQPEGMFSGRDIDFESTAFNAAFNVTCPSPKFASDVIHPRMMEFLLATRPARMCFFGNMLITYPHVHDTQMIMKSADFLTSFLGRIPDFVWKDLGAAPPVGD